MRRSYLWALLIALAVIGWMASGQFSSNSDTAAETDQAAAEAQKDDAIVKKLTINALVVKNTRTPLQVRASGVTRTSYEVKIVNRREAFVTAIVADEAKWVKKGDVLVELSKGTIEADLAAARADRQAANASYVDAKKKFSATGTLAAQLNAAESELSALKATYEATQKLVERGLQTDLTLSNQRAQVTAAETRLFELQSLSEEKELAASFAQLRATQARIAMLEEQLSFTTITAPQDGWLEAIHVERGEFVAMNSPVAQLLGLQELVLDVPVPQARIQDVTIGDMAEVEIIGGQSRTGKVTKIAAIANDATRTFTVEISLDNEAGNLRAGMSAEASVTIDMVNAFKISPAHLNIDDNGQLTAKIVDGDDKVAIAPVSLVRTTGNSAYISGLEDGAIVLAAGQAFLSKGEQVHYEIVTDEEAQ